MSVPVVSMFLTLILLKMVHLSNGKISVLIGMWLVYGKYIQVISDKRWYENISLKQIHKYELAAVIKAAQGQPTTNALI